MEKEEPNYEGVYFMVVKSGKKMQFLHRNKKGFEIRNKICANVVVFDENIIEHTSLFDKLKAGPYKDLEKEPVTNHLKKELEK